MKTLYFNRIGVAQMAALAITLPFQMLPIAEGATQPQNIDAQDIARLCVRVLGVGETGNGKPIGTEGANRYELNGSAITLHLAQVDARGEVRVLISGSYGQVRLHATIVAVVGGGTDTTVTLSPYVFDVAGAGGGADYKTDVYMDGGGRVIVERLENGSTIVSDEHENPILQRNQDGSTLIFDAYQSQRIALGPNGGVFINGLLTIGEQSVVQQDVGVNAFINGYGCLASGAYSHAEGTATVASGQGAHAEGSSSQTRTQTASGENSHAEGLGNVASGKNSHAEGTNCTAKGEASHAEGSICTAGGSYSHAEGSVCSANGAMSHAEGNVTAANAKCAHSEGSLTNAKSDASHAEGVYSIASGVGSHAQGYCNKEVAVNYSFVHGCGNSEYDRFNAFLIVGSQCYMLGVGGYDGKNYGEEGVLSVQQVLAEMLNPDVMTLSLDEDAENAPRITYKDKPVREWTAKDLAEQNADLLAEWERQQKEREEMKTNKNV